MQAQLHEPPPRLTELRPELPAAVDAVLASALSKTPEDGQSSAGALVREVGEALGVLDDKPGQTRRNGTGRFRRRPPDSARPVRRRSRGPERRAGPAAAEEPTAPGTLRAQHLHGQRDRPGTPQRGAARPRQATAAGRARDAARAPRRSRRCRRARAHVAGAPRPPCSAPCSCSRWPAPEWPAGRSAAPTRAPRRPCDPAAVKAQRAAEKRAEAAAATEQERVAWLGSANDAVETLNSRRTADRRRLAAREHARRSGRARPPAGALLRARAPQPRRPAGVRAGAAALAAALRRAESAYARLGARRATATAPPTAAPWTA